MLDDSIKKRISLITDAGDDVELLKKCVCPFFEKGGCPDCVACPQTEDTVIECKEYYLDKIRSNPMELWSEDFDKLMVLSRDKISLSSSVGIGLNCDSCIMSDRCPHFKKGYICAIDWVGDEKPKTPADFMDFLVNTQYERVKRAVVFEKIDGGVPDANLSGELDRLQSLVLGRVDMNREKFSVSVEASGPAPSRGGGILSAIFGKPASSEPEPIAIPEKPASRADVTDITEYEPIEEPVKLKRKRRSSDD